MSALRDVQGWMSFFGWTDGGSPGSVKMDACNVQIASHGDATWIKDVEICIEKAERQKLIAEIERREREGSPAATAPVFCKWPNCAKGDESPPRGRCECSVPHPTDAPLTTGERPK